MNEDSYSADGVSINNIQTVFDILSLIERNPKEYLGGMASSASYAALVGYLNALEYSHFFDAKEYSLKDFKEWAHNKYVSESADDFYRWVGNKHGQKGAFSEFFRVLSEYKAEKEYY